MLFQLVNVNDLVPWKVCQSVCDKWLKWNYPSTGMDWCTVAYFAFLVMHALYMDVSLGFHTLITFVYYVLPNVAT